MHFFHGSAIEPIFVSGMALQQGKVSAIQQSRRLSGTWYPQGLSCSGFEIHKCEVLSGEDHPALRSMQQAGVSPGTWAPGAREAPSAQPLPHTPVEAPVAGASCADEPSVAASEPTAQPLGVRFDKVRNTFNAATRFVRSTGFKNPVAHACRCCWTRPAVAQACYARSQTCAGSAAGRIWRSW